MTFKSAILTAYLLSLTTCDAFGFTSTTSVVNRASPLDGLRITHHQRCTTRTILTAAKKSEDESTNDDDDDETESKEEKASKEEYKEAEETPTSPASDILSSPSFLKRKLHVLKTDTDAVQEKMDAQNEIFKANKAEWGTQIDNLRTEYTNIEDRFKRMSKGETNTATMEVARKLLEVLDNFDRAFNSVSPESPAELAVEAAYKDAYAMVLTTFQDLGVTEVETVGLEFDYEFHQAVMTRPDEEHEEGVVCEELAKGYLMEDGKLIRAAMVVVAA
eukprot:CAMPEP_0198275894 /NCGR_PEP_ID=MMETSP1447-20131203/65021_1 /TAXON_ID=420782 /ORGANISM="Chaetoceros dichaeta, Strain CCMP1751" /LENGTH=274 /DNA_ID=CAMNT_0043970801 /DNA_START=62 /DNA_END=886 /DNA_ORIENTATION=-